MQAQSVYFAMGLLAAFYAACISERPHMRRTALVLVGTWLAVIIANQVTGKTDPVVAFIVIDTVAAQILLRQPANRLQAMIGAVYAFQIVGHFMRLVNVWDNSDQYLLFLASGGWLQIIIMIVGAVHGRGRRLAAGVDCRGNPRQNYQAHHRSVAGRE